MRKPDNFIGGRRALHGLFAAGLIGAFAAGLTGLASPAASQPNERRVTFLTINDVYRLDGVNEGKSGGLPRVRSLRSWIERDTPNTIFLHAGDFLSPSLIGKVFKGAQMVDVLNNLDGDEKAFDGRMFVAFGNHEFDDSRCTNPAAPLDARVAESQFTWVVSNLDFANCASMKNIPARPNVKDTVVTEVGGVKVGIFGIGQTPDKLGAPRYPVFGESLPAARKSIASLREQGADLIVALTHLPREDDEVLLRELAPAGLDLLVGGHDHTNMVLMDGDGRPRGFKADSDARSAWRIDAVLAPGKRPRIEAQLITLNEAIPQDEPMLKLAAYWAARADQEICSKRTDPQGRPAKPLCLEEQIGHTQNVIELEETANRSQETGFGDWLADAVKKATGSDVVIINSGILGLNEDLLPGSKLYLRHVIDMIRFDDVMAVRAFPAKQVCDAVEHGLLLPGMGGWPHLAGVRAEVKRGQGRYESAAVKSFVGKTGINCQSNRPITVAAPPFLLCGGDGYPLLKPSETCVADLQKNPYPTHDHHKPRTLSEITETAIRSANPAGIKPEKDGRVQIGEATPK